ncbi:MAG: hypothetical protein QOE31_166 [Solirubrobacteraceae bacterium]|nr:hypothetical protein [Solirubrobacteraceae bacterium]
MTIGAVWIAASYVIAIALPADQMRRSPAEWEAAGRDRRFWVTLTLVLGFHGLGQYAAAAYFVGVRPRLRAVERGGAPRMHRISDGLAGRWEGEQRERTVRRWQRATSMSAAEDLAVIAALLVLASSLIHAVVIAVHFEEYWLFGVLFAIAAVLQALWVAQVYSGPLTRRLLLVGAAGNLALAVVWALSRTVGLPIGPQARQPEAVGIVDTLSTLDELLAVLIIAVVLRCLRSGRGRLSQLQLRLTTAVAGALFLYSVLGPFAAGHHH